MRHSTITLTMDRYTHPFKGDEAKAVNTLPSLSWPGDEASSKTGTYDLKPLPGSRGAQRGALGGQQWNQSDSRVDSNDHHSCVLKSSQVPENNADLTLRPDVTKIQRRIAGVAELADATDSKSVGPSTEPQLLQSLNVIPKACGALSGAQTHLTDLDLMCIVDAWPTLPQAIRDAFVAMVKAAK
jgi:hypothetical protein